MPSGRWLREEERRLRRVSPGPAAGSKASAAAADSVSEGLRLRGFGDVPSAPSLPAGAGFTLLSISAMMTESDKAIETSGRRRGQTQQWSLNLLRYHAKLLVSRTKHLKCKHRCACHVSLMNNAYELAIMNGSLPRPAMNAESP